MKSRIATAVMTLGPHVLTLIFVLLCFGGSVEAQTPYFPLAVGMEWHYARSHMNHAPVDTVIVRITGMEQVNGRDYYVLHGYFFSMFPSSAQHLVREDGGKIWVLDDGRDRILYDFDNFPNCTGDWFDWWDNLVLSTGDTCYTDLRDGCPAGSLYVQLSPTRFRINICYLTTDWWWDEEFEEGVGLAYRHVGWYDGHYGRWNEYTLIEHTPVASKPWGGIKSLFRE